MKKILYNVCLLPLIVYAGGEFQPVDTQYNEIVDVKVEVSQPPKKIIPVEVNVVKTPKKVIPSETEKKSKYYLGVSSGYMDINGETNTIILKNAHPYILVAKAGYNLHNNIAIEARVGVGIKSEKNIPSAGIDTKLKNLWSLHLKPHTKLSDKININALLGYAQTQQSINNTTISTQGFSYGAGLGYEITKNIELVFDAIRYGKDATSKVDAYSIGLDYKF